MKKKTLKAKKINKKSASRNFKKYAKKVVKKIVPKRKPDKKISTQIDERLLDLPHSSLSKISKSLEKIENFSSDLAERSGITGILGRAVLFRAKAIRMSLNTKKSPKKSPKKNGA